MLNTGDIALENVQNKLTGHHVAEQRIFLNTNAINPMKTITKFQAKQLKIDKFYPGVSSPTFFTQMVQNLSCKC